MMHNLNELEVDALAEIFNIGVGQAAASLSQMTGDHIELSVPAFSFVTRHQAAAELTKDAGQHICGVSQHFKGSFDADAILMFPENKSLEIVRLLVGGDIPIEELTAMEQEALSEIGNIILNALIGTLANVLGAEFSCGLPIYHFGTSGEILHANGKDADGMVLLLHIGLKLERYQIDGYVAFLLDVNSTQGLKASISHFLGGIPG